MGRLRIGSGRFTTGGDEALGVGTVFITFKAAVELHVNKASALQKVAQLQARIDSVMEFESLYRAVLDEQPFVADTSPVVKDLMPLDQQGAVWQNVGDCWLKDFRQMFFAQNFDQA